MVDWVYPIVKNLDTFPDNKHIREAMLIPYSNMVKRPKNQNIWIVIAAFNESNRITKVISGLRDNGYHNIVVVDDGSSDNTCQILHNLPVYTLKHLINRGQGAALQTGITFALQNDAQYIITFDADGQHRVEDIPAMLKPIESQKADVTLGSRFLGSSINMPFTRYLSLKIGIIIQWIFYGVLLSDVHNGFRCFSASAAKNIHIRSDRMEHASEIIEQIKHLKLRVKEIPVTILYNDETLQKGHGGFLQGIKVLKKMTFRKFIR